MANEAQNEAAAITAKASDEHQKVAAKKPKNEQQTTEGDPGQGIESFLKDMFVLQKVVSFLKYLVLFLGIWLTGRLGFGYKWVLLATIVYFFWKANRDEKKRRKEAVGAALAKNEEEVLRARLGDLPTWVSLYSDNVYLIDQ